MPEGSLSFIGALQTQFLIAAARRGWVPSPPETAPAEWAVRARERFLHDHPGFRETLLAWEAPPCEPLDPDGAFTPTAIGRHYETFLGRSARQNLGTFYTPPELIRRLLGDAQDQLDPRWLDPAMGCGAFLAEALAMRDLSSPEARWAFVRTSLYGVDRDPVAREIAVLCLWLQAGYPEGDPREIQANLRIGNSLLPAENSDDGIDWPRDFALPMREGGFTAVVGNPPFVNIERLEPTEKARYRAAFPELTKRFDLFVPMATKALDLTRAGGIVSLLLPQPFLTQAYGEPLRRRFLTETTLLRLEEEGFPGASVRTVLLTARKAPAPADHRIRLASEGVSTPRGKTEARHEKEDRLGGNELEWLPQAPLLRLPEARIPSRGGMAFRVAHRALERGIPLGRVAFATWGVRGVPISAFHRDAPDHPACRPMIKGDAIQPYAITWGGKYLRYEPERLYRSLFPELFEDEKIVLRKVSGRRGMVAALDQTGYYTDDSVLCCQLRRQLKPLPAALARRYGGAETPPDLEAYDLPILLAVMNSRLGALVFDLLLGNGLNVYPAAVMRLPLPPVDPEGFALLRDLVSRRQTTADPQLEATMDALVTTMFGMDPASLPER